MFKKNISEILDKSGMTSKELVQKTHPELTLEKFYKAGISHGQPSSYRIVYNAEHTYELFGEGKTETKAWVAARKKIKASPTKETKNPLALTKTQTVREWLELLPACSYKNKALIKLSARCENMQRNTMRDALMCARSYRDSLEIYNDKDDFWMQVYNELKKLPE